ncbi:hypothetical protein PULV_a4163 [Pseudoalteromonas ulvae UL12]|nr:hypothetical protein [Pseudoalteromonas ulvae UL12]
MDTVIQHTIKQLPTLTAETEITHAINELQKHRLLGAPVLNEQRELIGFISEHELLKPMLSSSYFCDGVIKVKDLMRTDVVAVDAHTSIADLAERMLLTQPKNYPVVENNKVIGLINRSQVLSALAASYLRCQTAS